MEHKNTEFACPTCRDQGVKSQIQMIGGQKLQCIANSNHVWTDAMEFRNLRPTMEFSVPKAAPVKQVDYVSIQVSLPKKHAEILAAKLGDKFLQTVAGYLSMMAEGNPMIVPETDLDRINKLLNEKPQHSGELFGMIYALDLREKEAKASEAMMQEKLAAYKGANTKLAVINLGDQREYCEQKASAEGLPVDEYLSRYLRTAVENNWM